MIRTGIMGCAAIARRSLMPAFAAHPEFELAVVASRDSAKAAPDAGKYGCRACTYEELVAADDIDLVYCPLPTGLHHEWVKKCLQAGKHVLCEKSVACTKGEVEDLVATARAANRLLIESFQFRFHAQNLHIRKLLAEGAVGKIRQVVVRFGIPPFPEGAANIRYSRELGGGALLDNGAYTIKATTYLLGSDVKVLAAMVDEGNPELGSVDLTGAIMMNAAGIPVQTAYGFDHFYRNSIEIWGERGCISSTRAFTARADFEAPVTLSTKDGDKTEFFKDDHFARLLDHVSSRIAAEDYEDEYAQCLLQAGLIAEVKECL